MIRRSSPTPRLMVQASLPLAILLASSLSVRAQSITYAVTSAPTLVNLSGTQQVLGGVKLISGPAGSAVHTTSISTMQFWYQGVTITNPFDGALPVNAATGTIVHADGIVATFTGGYVQFLVTASVFNTTLGGTPVGVVTLSFPGGLSIAPGDSIQVNGVRVNFAGKKEGDSIDCLILASPSSSHVMDKVSVPVAFVVDASFRISTESLPDGFLGVGYSQTLTAIRGTPPYIWHVTAGSLPPPLSLDSNTGLIFGGPAAGGAFTFTIRVTDNTGATASKNLTITVQGLRLDRNHLDIGEAIVGTSLARKVMVTNIGTVAQDVVANISGHKAFAVSPAAFRVDAGKTEAISLSLTPADENSGLPFTGQVNILFSGLVRIVTLTGQSKASALPLPRVLPSSGPTVGNTRIRIRGSLLSSLTSAALGGASLSELTQPGADDWAGVTGPRGEGSVSLMITSANGSVVSIPNAFTYRQLSKAQPAPGDLRIGFVSDTSEFRSNLGINSLSGSPASVNVSLIENNGLIVVQQSVLVPPNGMTQINHILRYLEDAGEATGREGALLLHSDRPIRAWASQIDNVSLDPSLQQASAEGHARILVPSSVRTDRFSTALVISNLTSADGRLNIVARDRFGATQLMRSDVAIPAQGFLYFEDFYGPGGIDQSAGPIEVEAQGGIQLQVQARIYSRQNTGGFFPGISLGSAARTVVIPQALDTAAFRTNLGVNNSGSLPASVTISVIGAEGRVLGSFNDSVPAGGLVQWDNILRLLLGSASRTDIEGWLRIESDQNIIAWASQVDNTTQDPDFLLASSANVSSSRLLIPAVVSAGTFHSSLVVLNGDSAPNAVTLTARSPEGSTRLTQTVTIPANGFLQYADILDSLGLEGTFGPFEIVSSSNKPLLAISRVSSDQHTGGLLRTEELP